MGVSAEKVNGNSGGIDIYPSQELELKEGLFGREIEWKGLRVRMISQTPSPYKARVVEVREDWDANALPEDLKWSVILHDEELEGRRDYLLIDTEGSKNFVRIEFNGGKFLIFEGEKWEHRTAFWKEQMSGQNWRPIYFESKKRPYSSKRVGDLVELVYDTRYEFFTINTLAGFAAKRGRS